MTGATLDAGALVAIDGGGRAVSVLVRRTIELGEPVAVPAGALAQVWRDGARQARLSTLLRDEHVEVAPLDDVAARAAGQLCGATGTTDVIDASVVLCARARRQPVLTSDPGDLRRLDPRLRIVAL